MIHIRFDGRSYDLAEQEADLHVHWSDVEIKACLARYFDVHPDCLSVYVVDRRPNGDLLIRPEAVYG